jgi:hypothetical protein
MPPNTKIKPPYSTLFFYRLDYILEIYWVLSLFFLMTAPLLMSSKYYASAVYKLYLIPAGLYCLFKHKKVIQFIIQSKLIKIIFLWALWFSISSIWSTRPNATHDGPLLAGASFLFILSIAIIFENQKKIIFILIAWSTTISFFALFSIYDFYFTETNGFSERISTAMAGARGATGNSNVSAMYFGFACIISAAALRYSDSFAGAAKNRLRILLLLCFCITATYVWLTLSRSATIAIILTLLYIIFSLEDKKYFFIAALFPLVFILWVFLTKGFLFDSFVVRDGMSWRPEIFISFYHHMDDHWLFGYGALSKYNVVAERIYQGEAQQFIAAHPHNGFLLQIFYGGLILVLPYISIYILSLYQLFPYRNKPLIHLVFTMLIYNILVQQLDGKRIISLPDVYWIVFLIPFGLAASLDWGNKKRLIYSNQQS